MELLVRRKFRKEQYTIGYWYVDGYRFYESMEDKDRGLTSTMPILDILAVKVPGKTAIPTGTYEVVLSYSPKFGKKAWAKKYNGLVPEILKVRGFSGVRIHPMNTAEESDGCIGIGENKAKGKILNSQKCYEELMSKYLLPAWNRNEQILITIE